MLRRILTLAWSLPLFVGCSSPESAPTVLYDGAPTDEALESMLDLPSQSGPALTILSPVPREELDADTPLTVSFAEGNVRLSPPPARERSDQWLARSVQTLDAWFGVKAAYAHGTPYNGVAYLLEFVDVDQRKRLQVFTDQTSFTIPEAEWSELASSPSPVTLTVYSATFEENDVVSGGGPFERAHVAFSIR